jgi:hypothetical protein
LAARERYGRAWARVNKEIAEEDKEVVEEGKEVVEEGSTAGLLPYCVSFTAFTSVGFVKSESGTERLNSTES